MNKNEQMSYLGSIKAPEQEATMTPQELRELDALVSTSNLNKDDRERRLHLQTKFEGVNDRAKKEIPAYNALNRLLSAEGTNQ